MTRRRSSLRLSFLLKPLPRQRPKFAPAHRDPANKGVVGQGGKAVSDFDNSHAACGSKGRRIALAPASGPLSESRAYLELEEYLGGRPPCRGRPRVRSCDSKLLDWSLEDVLASGRAWWLDWSLEVCGPGWGCRRRGESDRR